MTFAMLISTLAPREGSDLVISSAPFSPAIFQPSLPARGATYRIVTATDYGRFQPSLPARGATGKHQIGDDSVFISTLAPREGSDHAVNNAARVIHVISTLAPREGSDAGVRWGPLRIVISTLAPREGSDARRRDCPGGKNNFNPRSPRGERLRKNGIQQFKPDFNPRSPRGERL